MSPKFLYLIPTFIVIISLGAAQAWVITRYFRSSSEDERIARIERALAERELALNQLAPRTTPAIQEPEKKREPASVR